MKVFFSIIVAAGLGYFLGSINFSIIVVRMMTGRDIRDMGSKNAGLTNTLRCAGKPSALLTLIGDLLKGVIAVFLARGFCHLLHAGMLPGNDTHYIGYIAGLFAIIGHVFPIYYGFKGGKGVLVGAASFLAVDYKVFLALLAIFVVILAISKYVSLASIIFITEEVISGTAIHSEEAVCICFFHCQWRQWSYSCTVQISRDLLTEMRINSHSTP